MLYVHLDVSLMMDPEGSKYVGVLVTIIVNIKAYYAFGWCLLPYTEGNFYFVEFWLFVRPLI
jgi:hypothetical protein